MIFFYIKSEIIYEWISKSNILQKGKKVISESTIGMSTVEVKSVVPILIHHKLFLDICINLKFIYSNE